MNDPDKHDVFISYRRSNGSALAQLVYQHLKKRGYRVFMDVRDLRSGSFDEELKQKIKDSTDVVVLVTPNCFARCTDEGDWFRVEIEIALASGCNVVPLRTEEVVMPSSEELPESISKISKHQSVKFNSEYCDAGLDRLCQLLKAHRRLARRRTTAIVAALLLLLIVGAAAMAVISRNDTSPPNSPTATPLGLYWHGFGQRQRDGRWEEFLLRDSMRMYSGDQFRLVFSANQDCYVYLLTVDATGSLGIRQRFDCLQNRRYQVPAGTDWFTLDTNTGRESIYLFASLTPIEDLESIRESSSANSHAAVATLQETTSRLLDDTRGVSIETDKRVAENTYSSGRTVAPEMNVIAGKVAAAEVIHFKHEAP